MQTYYKILRTNRASWYDEKFVWPLDKPVEVPDADQSKASCGRGVHLAKSINYGFQYAKFMARCFEARPLSPILGEDNSKIRVAKARLGREVTPEYVKRVNQFLRTIKTIKWFSNHREPLKSWQLFETRNAAWNAARNAAWNAARNAAGDAARNAAGDAAGDAAWNAAWKAAGNAAWNAARNAAWKAARNAAWKAARNAARNAAGDAAWKAARNAAWNAELMATILVCYGLKTLDEDHVRHALSRWEVWKRGYGLFGDINGELFVYKKVR